MRVRMILAVTAAAAVTGTVGLSLPARAEARSANVAALQVALRAIGVYGGGIDGIAGPRTRAGVRRFQRRRHLAVDGIAGPRTRRALGRRGRPRLGSRPMRAGRRGWDVAALQFMLRLRGFSPGTIDGGFGPATAAAVRSFQRSAGLAADGVAGPATLSALRRRRPGRRQGAHRPAGPVVGGPVLFFRPVDAPVTDLFGMRWGRMHMGIDFPAATGARVAAAGRGVTRFAGWSTGGYGNLVIVRHRLGFETWYAHLDRVTSWAGERVVGGTRIGLVGSTGYSTGPHLHFEVRHHGRPIDPMPRLLATAASAGRRFGPAASPAQRAAGSGTRSGRSAAHAGGGERSLQAGCDRDRLRRQAARRSGSAGGVKAGGAKAGGAKADGAKADGAKADGAKAGGVSFREARRLAAASC